MVSSILEVKHLFMVTGNKVLSFVNPLPLLITCLGSLPFSYRFVDIVYLCLIQTRYLEEARGMHKPGNFRRAWASLLVQWLTIRLPMQGTRVRALVWEDPTCQGATKPVHHSY